MCWFFNFFYENTLINIHLNVNVSFPMSTYEQVGVHDKTCAYPVAK